MENTNKNTEMSQSCKNAVMQSVLLPTELRLGNLINHKYSGVVSTDLHALSLINIQNSEKIDKIYSPIPITEEWLLKFKFNNNHWATKWILHDMPTPTGIQYIHQLQNLYFSLTQTELTVA